MAEVEVNRSVAWIKDIDRWPYFPWCPIKNPNKRESGGFPKIAQIHSSELSNVRSGSIWNSTTPEIIEEYDSVEALVAAGWVVD